MNFETIPPHGRERQIRGSGTFSLSAIVLKSVFRVLEDRIPVNIDRRININMDYKSVNANEILTVISERILLICLFL